MPTRASRPCAHPRCPELVTTTARCLAHTLDKQRTHDRARGTSTQRGYDAAWERKRKQALERDCFLCVRCKAQGTYTPAKEVDHITPLSQGGPRLDLDNLQSLCKACHSRKTLTEDGGRRYGR